LETLQIGGVLEDKLDRKVGEFGLEDGGRQLQSPECAPQSTLCVRGDSFFFLFHLMLVLLVLLMLLLLHLLVFVLVLLLLITLVSKQRGKGWQDVI
jgi:Flp pilus assembly protein TadB